MSRRAFLAMALALATAASACTPPASPVRARASARVPDTAAQPPATPSPAIVGSSKPATPTPGASLAPASPGAQPTPLLAAATLTGKVKAPAGVLSKNGANVVSNNGAGIISDQGGQLAVAGATVRVLDAGGRALLAGGQPITALTAPDGSYAITAPLPDQPLVLSVELAAGRGALTALRPVAPAGYALLASAATVVDVDLASTLATTYVLEQYVRPQADPLATLAKLSPPVEAETRRKTADALAGGRVAVPDALTPSAVVTAVEALRSQDASLDAQLTTVRCLLVAAGQCDQGNGRLATEVALGQVQQLLQAPDGGLLIATGDRRVWKLRADGRIVALVGAGGPPQFQIGVGGLPATRANLGQIQGLALDARGRLLILESPLGWLGNGDVHERRVTRLEDDGTLQELRADRDWPDGEYGAAVGSGPAGEVWVLGSSTLWELGAGGWSRKLSITSEDALTVNKTAVFAQDARRRFLLSPHYETTLYQLDPAGSGRLEPMLAPVEAEGRSVDAGGNVFTVSGGKLLVAPPGGTARTLVEVLPAVGSVALGFAFNLNGFGTKGVALAADGSAYVAQQFEVFKAQGGRLTRVAGTEGAATGDAGNLALQYPAGLAPAPDGSLLVADAGTHRLLRLDGAGKITSVAGNGQPGSGPVPVAPTAAADVTLYGPWGVRRAVDGTTYLVDELSIAAMGTDGRVKRVYYHNGFSAHDVAPAPDGAIFFCELGVDGLHILRLAPGATEPEQLALEPKGVYELQLTVDAAGTLYLLGAGQLRSWTRAAGFRSLAKDDRLTGRTTGLARDAAGRFYFVDQEEKAPFAARIWRFDPAGGTFTAIAGPGSTHFAGSGADQSLDGPRCPVLAADGTLYFCDTGHRQVKTIPAAELP